MKDAMEGISQIVTVARQAYEHALRVGFDEQMAAKIALEIVGSPFKGGVTHE
jgi:hypothetical protein